MHGLGESGQSKHYMIDTNSVSEWKYMKEIYKLLRRMFRSKQEAG